MVRSYGLYVRIMGLGFWAMGLGLELGLGFRALWLRLWG